MVITYERWDIPVLTFLFTPTSIIIIHGIRHL